ncbi:hypothetical protein PRJ_Dakar_00426 [Faustovirus]|nr:hypothetical protein PRJ_Dakar_00426 [Faustovirus]
MITLKISRNSILTTWRRPAGAMQKIKYTHVGLNKVRIKRRY